MNALVLVITLASPALSSADEARRTEDVQEAIQRGLHFLVSTQNADGSWGGVKNATFCSSFGNPATYDCWQTGTTGLATQAVMQIGAGPDVEKSVTRGLAWVIAHRRRVRPADWDVDNVWALIYGLTVLSRALDDPRFQNVEGLREAASEMATGLGRYQSPRGGWGYYADPDSAWQPDWATSFTTSAGVLALLDAKKAGIDVDEKVLGAAVKAVQICRLRNGAYSYSVDALPRHLRLEDIDQVKGSLGRIQVGNYALYRAGARVAEPELAQGLELFFREHRFLDAARNKPIPHEAYYYNAAYFYLFGHYYAAQVISVLPPEKRAGYAERLQPELLKCQQKDGCFWDFWIANDTKAYGTAFAIMALAATLPSPPDQ